MPFRTTMSATTTGWGASPTSAQQAKSKGSPIGWGNAKAPKDNLTQTKPTAELPAEEAPCDLSDANALAEGWGLGEKPSEGLRTGLSEEELARRRGKTF